MDILTHPVVAMLVIVLLIVLVFGGPVLQARERRRVDKVLEGEQEKGSDGRSRDSRKQGTLPIESVIESSDRPKSGRSESSMEERINELRKHGVPLGDVSSVLEAELRLSQAEAARSAVRHIAVRCRHPELVGSLIQQAEQEVEDRRNAHNRVLIEARERSTLCAGQVRVGRQFKIGVESRSVA